jgi:acyl-CoA synthetase (AMP-forming)/AMP-acid ligase II
MSLSVGATAVLEGHWDAAGSLDFAAATGANFLGSPPVLLERLLREARRRGLQRLPIRAASLGGAALSRRLLDDASATFGIRIQRVYGSSEAPNTAASQPTDRPEGHADDGVLLDGVEVSIGTAANPGECRVRGPHLFSGYVDDRDTQASFDGDWFCTGDLVDLRAGRVSVVGRIKEIAIRNGVNVSLNEVDEALAGLTGVTEWAACRLPDDDTGERVAVAVSAADRRLVTLDAVRNHLRSVGLAPRKWPEQVIYWPGPLPRTATGKVRREELAADARLTESEFAERVRH